MTRRDFLRWAALGSVHAWMGSQAPAAASEHVPPGSSPFRIEPFELEEATLADLQAGMTSGKESAVSLTEKYLERIDALDQRGPTLRSVLEVTPDARSLAREA